MAPIRYPALRCKRFSSELVKGFDATRDFARRERGRIHLHGLERGVEGKPCHAPLDDIGRTQAGIHVPRQPLAQRLLVDDGLLVHHSCAWSRPSRGTDAGPNTNRRHENAVWQVIGQELADGRLAHAHRAAHQTWRSHASPS